MRKIEKISNINSLEQANRIIDLMLERLYVCEVVEPDGIGALLVNDIRYWKNERFEYFKNSIFYREGDDE